MADTIFDLPGALPLAGLDLLEIDQVDGGGRRSSNVDLATLKSWLQFKNNLSATADPAANDDSTAGYEAGSRWLNNAVSPKVWWICTDATAGAAVWDVLSLSKDELGTAALVNTGTGAGDVPLNSDLGSAAYESAQKLPFFNWLPAHGRFSDDADFDIYDTGVFSVPSSMFSPYNGASMSEAGKFIHNNTTNGGSAGALDQSVIDLLADMGRGGGSARYGVEFRVARITAGAGTTGPISGSEGDKYPVSVSLANVMTMGMDNHSVVYFWVRAFGSKAYLFNSSPGAHAVNGVPVGATVYELDPSEGYVFYRAEAGSSFGYTTTLPRICCVSGDGVDVALPSKFSGVVNLDAYTAPIPSAGSLP
jgi:hypothetical protein